MNINKSLYVYIYEILGFLKKPVHTLTQKAFVPENQGRVANIELGVDV